MNLLFCGLTASLKRCWRKPLKKFRPDEELEDEEDDNAVVYGGGGPGEVGLLLLVEFRGGGEQEGEGGKQNKEQGEQRCRQLFVRTSIMKVIFYQENVLLFQTKDALAC